MGPPTSVEAPRLRSRVPGGYEERFPMTRTERTFYLLFGSYSLAQFFLAPVYPLFLLSRGLDLLEINLILAIYLITIFVFEVPTGALADTARRRVPFVLGCATRTDAVR